MRTRREFGEPADWSEATRVLRDELPTADVTVSGDHSLNLAQALVRGRLDLAILRAEPDFDLEYRVVGLPFAAMVNKVIRRAKTPP
jgi:LysR family hca operon transcriptional activator